MNKIMLIGNLGRDPEMNYTPNGIAVTKFSLAVSRIISHRTVKAGGDRMVQHCSLASSQRPATPTCGKVLRYTSKAD